LTAYGEELTMKTYKYEDLFSDIPDDPDNVLLTFPPELIKEAGWKEGDTLSFAVENGNLVINKVDNVS